MTKNAVMMVERTSRDVSNVASHEIKSQKTVCRNS